jgi:uncharacterized alpha-E superfamily protein
MKTRMLCRTASDLYWCARHIERAENTARLIDVTRRIAMLPERLDRGKSAAAPWRRALDAVGKVEDFRAHHGEIEPRQALHYLMLDASHSSSIFTCLRASRESARAQRVAITSEMYEDLNTSWIEMRSLTPERLAEDGLSHWLEWVKSRSASFRGVTIGTLGRGEGYHFLQLGAFIERADWAVRLLDIKSADADLPDPGEARDAVDYYQWSALLQSLSAFETYRRHYRESVSPAGVAALMLVNEDNPRSLASCTRTIYDVLERLAGRSDLEVVRQAGLLASLVRFARVDQLLASGLEAHLQEFMGRLTELGDEIHRQFMASGDADMAA